MCALWNLGSLPGKPFVETALAEGLAQITEDAQSVVGLGGCQGRDVVELLEACDGRCLPAGVLVCQLRNGTGIRGYSQNEGFNSLLTTWAVCSGVSLNGRFLGLGSWTINMTKGNSGHDEVNMGGDRLR